MAKGRANGLPGRNSCPSFVYFTKITVNEQDSEMELLQCNACESTYAITSSADRRRKHLVSCPKVEETVRIEFSAMVAKTAPPAHALARDSYVGKRSAVTINLEEQPDDNEDPNAQPKKKKCTLGDIPTFPLKDKKMRKFKAEHLSQVQTHCRVRAQAKPSYQIACATSQILTVRLASRSGTF